MSIGRSVIVTNKGMNTVVLLSSNAALSPAWIYAFSFSLSFSIPDLLVSMVPSCSTAYVLKAFWLFSFFIRVCTWPTVFTLRI
jgi:hypothetical protein